MSLAHVILGLLQQQKRTGYDLKTECFDRCIAHLWQADQAQIYRTLDKLEAQGWITCTVEIQHDRPNRKIYQITEAGESELRCWLQTHQPLPVLREPLLAQLHFAAQLPNDAIIHLLEQELKARHQKLASCEALRSPSASGNSNISSLAHSGASSEQLRQQKMHQLVLELITQREQTYLRWLNDAIEMLRRQPGQDSENPF